MTDEPEDDEIIDWTAIREASIHMAELFYSYHQALIAAGFSDANAIKLTLGYQNSFLSQMHK